MTYDELRVRVLASNSNELFDLRRLLEREHVSWHVSDWHVSGWQLSFTRTTVANSARPEIRQAAAVRVQGWKLQSESSAPYQPKVTNTAQSECSVPTPSSELKCLPSTACTSVWPGVVAPLPDAFQVPLERPVS